jgi:hypothetical protein
MAIRAPITCGDLLVATGIGLPQIAADARVLGHLEGSAAQSMSVE